MPILGVKSKRDDYKLVGVQVTPRVHNYLTLYTLAKGITKAELFLMLIEQWMEQTDSSMSEKELTKELFERINKEWKELKLKKPRSNFDEFKTRLKSELLKKGLEERQVTEIIIKLIK
ncbi:MAG: hypothetical protein BWX51_02163 [Bacteroidetes bacterium ADurb.Bin012]|jgi:hypothetical protein|nr:MAG: hypothetical protein BWX51_02163 [Bacteroidetes bacterium ADurb.Bin012]